MHSCPNCSSTRVAHFRLDSDWGDSGSCYAANTNSGFEPLPEAGYTDDDLYMFDNNDWPDIECYVCLECLQCF